MRVEDLRRSAGKPVRDIYGRHSGVLNGYTIDSEDRVTMVALEVGGGQLRRFPANRFVTGDEGPLLLPEWKLQTEGIGKDISTLKKRIEALKVLGSEGEVSSHSYEELENEYSSKLRALEENYNRLSEQLSARIQELDEEVATLEHMIVEAKIQYRAGEIDNESYELLNGNCVNLRAKNLQEKEEIQRVLKSAGEPEVLRMSMTLGTSAPKAVTEQ